MIYKHRWGLKALLFKDAALDSFEIAVDEESSELVHGDINKKTRYIKLHWNNVLNPPSFADLTHRHPQSDIDGLPAALTSLSQSVSSLDMSKASKVHGHAMSEIDGLVQAHTTINQTIESNQTATTNALNLKADLDPTTRKIPTSQLPAIALHEAKLFQSQAEMLATTLLQPGDVGMYVEAGKVLRWLLTQEPASTLDNWTRLTAVDTVSTFKGRLGDVLPQYGDYEIASIPGLRDELNLAARTGGIEAGQLVGFQKTSSITTRVLNPNETISVPIQFASKWDLLKVSSDKKVRIRGYMTEAQAVADAARSVGAEPPVGNHGVWFDLSIFAASDAQINPLVSGYSVESPRNDNVYLSITNTDTVATAITCGFSYVAYYSSQFANLEFDNGFDSPVYDSMYSWRNQGTATHEYEQSHLKILNGSKTARVTDVGSGTWVVSTRLQTSTDQTGLVCISTAGKNVLFTASDGQLNVSGCDALTSTLIPHMQVPVRTSPFYYLKIAQDGTKLSFLYSLDNVYYSTIHEETLASYIVDVKSIGVYVNNGIGYFDYLFKRDLIQKYEPVHQVAIQNTYQVSSTELTAALAGKSSIGHHHTKAEIDDFAHGHEIGNVSGLNTALSGKADTVHSHEITAVNGLQTALDQKTNTGHSHTILNVTGLGDALAGKADTNALGSLATKNANQVKLTDLAVAADVDTSNATTQHPGLMPKLSGDAQKYIGGDGLEHTLPSASGDQISSMTLVRDGSGKLQTIEYTESGVSKSYAITRNSNGRVDKIECKTGATTTSTYTFVRTNDTLTGITVS